MKKTLPLTTLILATIMQPVRGQLYVNGHGAAYDSLTSTLLATVPEALFGQGATLSIRPAEGWQQLSIDDIPVDGTHTFTTISADSTYHVTLSADSGQQLDASLQFTFLPIVRLVGTFGNDYQGGTLTIADPSIGQDRVFQANVKWRGGTTNANSKHKRNYKVKLSYNTSLFGMRSDNNWILDAGQADVFRLRNRVAMDLWNDMAHQPYYADQQPKARNGVQGQVVELFLGDEYRGIYNFSENIDVKQLKLKKVDDETGEIHGCLYKAVSWQKTQMFDLLQGYDNESETFLGFEAKYPDLSDSDTTCWQPLVNVVNTVRGLSSHEFAEQVDDYFDLPVLLDYSLFVSVTNALDNAGKNLFWAVYDKAATQRLTLAPWDLDCTFGQRWGGTMGVYSSARCITDVTTYVWYKLYETNAHQFNDRLNERYRELRQEGGLLSNDSLISRFTACYHTITKSGAARREAAKWSGDSDVWGAVINFDTEYTYICNWIKTHMRLLDTKGFPLVYTQDYFAKLGIDGPTTDGPVTSPTSHVSPHDHVYTLGGQRVAPGQALRPGIYIKNGKKIKL